MKTILLEGELVEDTWHSLVVGVDHLQVSNTQDLHNPITITINNPNVSSEIYLQDSQHTLKCMTKT